MVVDGGDDHHFVNLRPLDKLCEPGANNGRRTDDRAREARRDLCFLQRIPVTLDVLDRRRQASRVAADTIGDALLRRGEQPPRLLVRVGSEDVHRGHRVRRGERCRRRERLAVRLERGHQQLRREVRREHVPQSELPR